MKPTRIAFYGNFGAGNLGNECTLQAVLGYARRRWPGASMLCFCTEPQDVLRRHGIPGMRAMALGEEWSWTSQAGPAAGGAAPTDAELAARKAQTLAPAKRRGPVMRLLRILTVRIPLELAQWAKLFGAVRRCDILIIAGTGILTDDSGALLWPYDMFRLSALAALCRVKLLYLSMGAGPIRAKLSRWFFRHAVGFAQYRSYRDNDSKQYMQGIGFDTSADRVYPDLAFGLPSHQLAAQAGAQPQSRRIVGLGLKDYSADKAGSNSYLDYIEAMAGFVAWLNGRGYTVRLLIGDAQYDSQVRLDLLNKLRSREGGAPAVVVDPVPTVEELLRQLAECDFVISPRFHNLVLGLSLYKPVIALSDLRKVEVLLGDMGLSQYVLKLASFNTATLVQRFTELENDAERLKFYIKEKVDRMHAAVEQQYTSLFDGTAVERRAEVSASS